MDTAFVVSVKYANHIRIFITATSKGEVKLWNNFEDFACLGIINTISNNFINTPTWDPKPIMNAVHRVRVEEK